VPAEPAESPQFVAYEVDAAGVGTVTLDDGGTRNALSPAMVEGLLGAFQWAADDERVRCVVLRSSHPTVFSSGASLGTFAAEAPLATKHFATERLLGLFKLIGSFPKPTLCAVGGHALAGAIGIVLCCDLVVASETATFGTPEIGVGTFPFMVMALLYRNVPRKKANEMLLLGGRLSAPEALQAGIVNTVVAPDRLDEAVGEWAGRLAGSSAVIMRLGKEAMRRHADMGLDDALDYLRAQLSLALSTQDIVEGVSAFFEKRQPVWTDR
jgi:enoyl-CoA hydratase/carnithine racemase